MVVKPVTNEELVQLIQSHNNEQSNLGLLYEQNKGFIRQLALPYSKKVDIEDLMQEAYFALMNAAYSFDTKKECCFTTYATYKIQAQMQRYCFNNGSVKRIPIHILRLIHKFHSYKRKYYEENYIFRFRWHFMEF